MSDILTVVGQHTVIKGALEGDEDLTVLGKVEGQINLTKTLIIEASGIVVADIEVRDAIVSGVVVGNITASNSVQITEEGRMVGDLSAPRVIIVDGASFKGHVDMGDLTAPLGEGRSPAPPATRVSRPSLAERQAAPARLASSAAPSKPAPAPVKPPPKPMPKAPPPKPKAPIRPAPVKPGGGKKRKPPRPPSVPSGKRKVKRRK